MKISMNCPLVPSNLTIAVIGENIEVSVRTEDQVRRCVQAQPVERREDVDEIACAAVEAQDRVPREAHNIQIAVGTDCHSGRVLKSAGSGRYKRGDKDIAHRIKLVDGTYNPGSVGNHERAVWGKEDLLRRTEVSGDGRYVFSVPVELQHLIGDWRIREMGARDIQISVRAKAQANRKPEASGAGLNEQLAIRSLSSGNQDRPFELVAGSQSDR